MLHETPFGTTLLQQWKICRENVMCSLHFNLNGRSELSMYAYRMCIMSELSYLLIMHIHVYIKKFIRGGKLFCIVMMMSVASSAL